MRYLINFLCKVLRFDEFMYPMFNPDRPYFVNLAYLYRIIIQKIFDKTEFHNNLFRFYFDYKKSMNVQRHYLKYLKLFGPEEKLPGFLMTNQQMLTFIQDQTECTKYQDGFKRKYSLGEKSIFNCCVEYYGWRWRIWMELKLSIKTKINNGEGEKKPFVLLIGH